MTFPHDVALRVLNGFVGSRPRLHVEVLNRPAQFFRGDMNATNSSRNRRRTGHDKPECGSYLFAIASIHGVAPATFVAGGDLQIRSYLTETGSRSISDPIAADARKRVARRLFGSRRLHIPALRGCWLAHVLSSTAEEADVCRRDEPEPDGVGEYFGRAQNGRDQVPIQPPFAAWCHNMTASNGGGNMHGIIRVAVGIGLAVLAGGVSAQQNTPVHPRGGLPERDALNANTVTVITAPIGGPMSIMGSDMAAVLDDGDNLRVLPILGKGSAQNLVDIIRLKNIDMGFVTADALEFVKTEYNMPDIAKRVRYIAPLFHNDIHIVARQGIRTLAGSQRQARLRRAQHRPAGGPDHLPADGNRGGYRFANRSDRRIAEAAERRTGCVDRERVEERTGHQGHQERGRQIPSADDPLRSGAAGHLSAVNLLVRGISEPGGAGRQGRQSRGFDGADGVQLAGPERSLPTRGPFRRRAVRPYRAIAAAAAQSEMARYRSSRPTSPDWCASRAPRIGSTRRGGMCPKTPLLQEPRNSAGFSWREAAVATCRRTPPPGSTTTSVDRGRGSNSGVDACGHWMTVSSRIIPAVANEVLAIGWLRVR